MLIRNGQGGGIILTVISGDITKENTDYIVNGRGPGTDLTDGNLAIAVN